MVELSLEYAQSILGKKHSKVITQDIVDDINKLTTDPDFGSEYMEAIITYTSILEGKENYSLQQYISAVKFYSLTAGMSTQVDAYCKVFPERLQARLDRGQDRVDMTGEASRFNSTALVTKIRSQAIMPLHLVNMGNLQLGINTLVDICVNSRSDIARGSAAATLVKELRPPEVQKVELQVGLSDDVLAAQNKQTDTLVEIARSQRQLLIDGHSISDIQKIHIKPIDVIDVESE